MHEPLTFLNEPLRLDRTNLSLVCKHFQGHSKVLVAAPHKVEEDLSLLCSSQDPQRPQGRPPFVFFFRQFFCFRQTREELFCEAIEILIPLPAHDHHLSAHVKMKEHNGHIATSAPAVRTP